MSIVCIAFKIWRSIGVPNPVDIAKVCFDCSLNSTAYLKDSILGSITFELDVQSCRDNQSVITSREQHFTAIFNNLLGLFPPVQ